MYSSSTAAAYMSDPRLCASSALRLATPDNKHGKQAGADNVDKLIPVKEETEPQSAGADMTATEFVVGGVNGAGDMPGAPLAVPLDNTEHEFRKPLLPLAPVRGQAGPGAAFKEQIGQYLPKWGNRRQVS